MSESPKKKHVILVDKSKLTAKNISPTAAELFDLMHLTTCEIAVKRWNPTWFTCPVCAETYKLKFDSHYGVIMAMTHKDREELKC